MDQYYNTLGVSPSATDEQVRAAYLELVKKYHPDNYKDNPIADLAQEKMQEINAAYDAIMNSRRAGSAGGGSSFADVRRFIQQKRIAEAEEILNGTPEANRDAEWYFLKGSVYYTRGWLNEAYTHFAEASRRNPSNAEYSAALNQMNFQRGGGTYGPGGYRMNNNNVGGGCSTCDVCIGLWCCDSCCECGGCDLITCC